MERRQILCGILDGIDRRINDRLDLDTISKMSGYSAASVSRLFRDLAGITPMRYVNVQRVICAAECLTRTKERITDIAFSCGFESLEVFERSFKRYFGISAYSLRKDGFQEYSPFYLSPDIYYERMREHMKIDGGTPFD